MKIWLTKDSRKKLRDGFYLVKDEERWVAGSHWCCRPCSIARGRPFPVYCLEIPVTTKNGKEIYLPLRLVCRAGCGQRWSARFLEEVSGC